MTNINNISTALYLIAKLLRSTCYILSMYHSVSSFLLCLHLLFNMYFSLNVFLQLIKLEIKPVVCSLIRPTLAMAGAQKECPGQDSGTGGPGGKPQKTRKKN